MNGGEGKNWTPIAFSGDRTDGRRLYLINKVAAKECTLGREWTPARYQRYRVQQSGDERAAKRAEGCQRARSWAMIIESTDDDNSASRPLGYAELVLKQ